MVRASHRYVADSSRGNPADCRGSSAADAAMRLMATVLPEGQITVADVTLVVTVAADLAMRLEALAAIAAEVHLEAVAQVVADIQVAVVVRVVVTQAADIDNRGLNIFILERGAEAPLSIFCTYTIGNIS